MKKNLLTSAQKKWLKKYVKSNNIHLKISNLEGLAYLLKTGCQWWLLPEYYGEWQTIYYHFRTLGDKEIFCKIKRKLIENKRIKSGKRKYPSVAVIDKSKRTFRTVKIRERNWWKQENQGHKAAYFRRFRRKSAWNHHHKGKYSRFKSFCRTHFKTKINFPNIEIIKADNGYKSNINSLIKDLLSIDIQCVKSNFGTSEFIPIQGRWVVERTISWLDNFRRLARNYEQFLHTAQIMAEFACMMFLLKHI